jgi:hypothetical protein
MNQTSAVRTQEMCIRPYPKAIVSGACEGLHSPSKILNPGCLLPTFTSLASFIYSDSMRLPERHELQAAMVVVLYEFNVLIFAFRTGIAQYKDER